MTTKIDLLDHGYVRLCDHMGNDLTVVRRARHLPDASWRPGTDKGTDYRLIDFLMENKHTSPFEFVEFDFEIKAPIFVARQWMRHRTWNYNEISGRYQELPAEFYVPSPEVAYAQATGNKQGRIPSGDVHKWASEVGAYSSHCSTTFNLYRRNLKDGWPRELARGVLPVSTYTVFSGKIDLHNLLHFLNLRLDEHAQYEIRVYAEAILQLIEPIVPVTVEAWQRHRGRVRPTEKVVEDIRALVAKLDTVHVDRLYVMKDYTLGDLRKELLKAIGGAR